MVLVTGGWGRRLDAIGRIHLSISRFRTRALRIGRPEVFNTDQGSQFTSLDYVGLLESNDIAVSMDGRGRALDNVFVERLWRTVKWEHVYPCPYDTVPERIAGLSEYFRFYNEERPHQALGYRTPASIYRTH